MAGEPDLRHDVDRGAWLNPDKAAARRMVGDRQLVLCSSQCVDWFDLDPQNRLDEIVLHAHT